MYPQTHTPLGHRNPLPPARVKTIEDYLTLEQELARIMSAGPVHFWGGPDTGVWVESEGECRVWKKWTRDSDAALELVTENEVWVQPYPVDCPYCYEGKFLFEGRFFTVYTPYKDHESKTLAYRYAVVEAVIAKFKKINKLKI